ncbi:MAG TPA: hypothetical protein VIJ95_04805 [Hanamia sp.]
MEVGSRRGAFSGSPKGAKYISIGQRPMKRMKGFNVNSYGCNPGIGKRINIEDFKIRNKELKFKIDK